jgi:hypothetical protein
MSRRPAITTQADVARAIRAAQQCGAGVVEIKPDGTIRVVVEKSIPVQAPEPALEEDDKVVL